MTTLHAGPLLEPLDFGPYRLPNRIVMSPMTRNRSPGELPKELNALCCAQRATAPEQYRKRMAMARKEREQMIRATGVKAE